MTAAWPTGTTNGWLWEIASNGANRTQLTDTTGAMTEYGYDNLDRLTSVTSPGPTTTAYGYDGNGNRLTSQVDANPAVTYGSDAADQLTTLGSETNAYDANGRLLLTNTGITPSTFDDSNLYDDAGQLIRTGLCRSDVNGDGNISSADYQGDIFARAKAGGVEGQDAYDVLLDIRGHGMITSSDAQIAFADFKSGKTCANTGADTGTADYSYNGDGLRVKARTFPNFIATDDDFIWDQGASLPEVLQDTKTQNGVSSTTTYVYGLNGPVAETDGSGVTSYYLQDGLGSTMQLTDTSGAVTDSYAYDAFGAMTSHTGTNPQPFGYAGQQQDLGAEGGLVYLRAREYDPALGRFLTEDPLPFAQRYAYAGGDPVNFTDPTGLCYWYCDPSPSIQGISRFTKKEIIEPIVRSSQGVGNHLGYVDLNLTACLPGYYLCGTAGVQASIRDGMHGYAGFGTGVGYGVSLTYAPGQRTGAGWFCGAQGSLGYASLQGGVSGGGADGKEGGLHAAPFGEAGIGIGTEYVATCAHVF